MPDETSSAGTATQAAPASSGATVSSGGTATSTASGATVTSGGTATQSSQPTSTPASSGTTTSGGTASSPAQGSSSSSSSSTSSSTAPSGFHADGSGHLVLEVGVPFSCPLTAPIDATTKLVGLVPPGVYLDVANKRLVGTPSSAMTTTLIIQTAGHAPVSAPIIVYKPMTVGFVAFGGAYSNDNPLPAKRAPGGAPEISVIANGGTGIGTYKFSISGVPGLSIDTDGNITGSLPTQTGSYPAKVIVSDEITSITITVTFDVVSFDVRSPDVDDATFWSNASAFWAAFTSAFPATTWTYNGTTYTSHKTVDTIVSYLNRFVDNPTTAGWAMIGGMCNDIMNNVYVGGASDYTRSIPGSSLITVCVLYQLYTLANQSGEATRTLRTNPAIVLSNNYKNIARVIDKADSLNTDLLS